MAHHAPVDLLALLWRLPVFDTLYRPYKYFSFEIAFTVAIVGGYTFHLLRQLHSRRVEALLATILIAFSVGFLYPRSATYPFRQRSRETPRQSKRRTIFSPWLPARTPAVSVRRTPSLTSMFAAASAR
jgi:hypothetical protein